MPVEQDPGSKNQKLAMSLATGWVILRHRPYRRNLLFFTTLSTLVLLFLGAVPLAPVLAASPFWFALFWIAVFLLASFVLLLAIYDLIRIRKEHHARMAELENELAEAAEEARRLAEEMNSEDGKPQA
jgi:hypothetical protein